MSLSKSAAIRAARAFCSIYSQGGDYIISGPYRLTELGGAYTTMQRHSFIDALRARAIWRAEIAMYLMGEASRVCNVEIAAQDWRLGCTLPGLVKRALEMSPAYEEIEITEPCWA